MSNEPKNDPSDEKPANAEEIADESLEQAEGGFALSGMFTKTIKTPVDNFKNLSAPQTISINTPIELPEDAAANFVRKRPGRKSF